jgi:hypothetical protein
MGNTYYPDGWCIIRLLNNDYRVFASWGGGYLHGDSWRINSGVASFTETETHINFIGDSGSVYVCAKSTENRLTGYNMSVLDGVLKRNVAVIVQFEKFKEDFELPVAKSDE